MKVRVVLIYDMIHALQKTHNHSICDEEKAVAHACLVTILESWFVHDAHGCNETDPYMRVTVNVNR